MVESKGCAAVWVPLLVYMKRARCRILWATQHCRACKTTQEKDALTGLVPTPRIQGSVTPQMLPAARHGKACNNILAISMTAKQGTTCAASLEPNRGGWKNKLESIAYLSMLRICPRVECSDNPAEYGPYENQRGFNVRPGNRPSSRPSGRTMESTVHTMTGVPGIG